MKVEFKHNCEIQGQKFGFEKHLQPGIHKVPASFVFDWFFVALVLDGHAKILEAHVNEFETLDKEMLEKLNPKLLNLLADLTDGEKEDEEESDDEEENDSEDDSSDSDDSVSDSEGSDEVSPEESEAKVSKKKLKKKGKK